MPVLLAAALLVGQPAEKNSEPAYTAFPDLKPLPFPQLDRRDETFPAARDAYQKAMARLVYPEPPALPAAPTPLQKVRHEQVRAGYLFLMKAHTVLECGRVDSPFYPTYLQVATDTYRVAAELDPAPGWRVRCYEARVILMKDCERVIKARVDAEVEPPHSADQARFTRLQAEADLLKLKAEVEKAGKK